MQKSYQFEVDPIHSSETHEDINLKDDDQLLSRKIDVRLAEGKSLHDNMCRIADENMKLFRGQIDKVAGTDLAKYKSKTVMSRLFLTIRNLVGLATDNPAFIEIIPAKDTPKSLKKAKKIEANVEWGMLRTNFNDTIAECLFDTWIKRDSYIRWFWNYDKNDFDQESVLMDEITIAPDGTDIQDAEFVIYHPLKNRQWFKKNYPEHYDNIKFDAFTAEEASKGIGVAGGRGTVARFINYWENDLVISKVKAKEGDDIILEKKKNPYFEYREPADQFADYARETNPEAMEAAELGGLSAEEVLPEEAQEFEPIMNFLPESRKPFVQIPSVRLAKQLYSENVVGQSKEAFIAMNNKKRAFEDNLRGCNQKVIVDTNSFNEEEQNRITDEPNQVIGADFSINAKPVYIEKGGEVPQSFHEDISHDEKYIDDVFGHHEISRGTGKAKTLGQDQLNAESDRTPVRFQTRATERAIVEVVQGWVQLMKMYYTETHYSKKFGSKEGIELMEMIQSDVEEGVEPYIKPGSMMTISKSARASRAMEMFSGKALDPYTLFVEMDMPNPSELADRLINWLQAGMVTDEDPEQIKADMKSQAGTEGDLTEDPIERADQENKSIQAGSEVPPTPPEYVTMEHVKLHFAFAKDPNKKMEDDDREILLAHAEVDKATLAKLMAEGVTEQTREEPTETKEPKKTKKDLKK